MPGFPTIASFTTNVPVFAVIAIRTPSIASTTPVAPDVPPVIVDPTLMPDASFISST